MLRLYWQQSLPSLAPCTVLSTNRQQVETVTKQPARLLLSAAAALQETGCCRTARPQWLLRRPAHPSMGLRQGVGSLAGTKCRVSALLGINCSCCTERNGFHVKGGGEWGQ